MMVYDGELGVGVREGRIMLRALSPPGSNSRVPETSHASVP